jgi:hypothetical protein
MFTEQIMVEDEFFDYLYKNEDECNSFLEGIQVIMGSGDSASLKSKNKQSP